jgi:DDE superfamily endonuclease
MAVACELPAQRDQPLSRYSIADLQQVMSEEPAVGPLSRSTVWRILDRAVLKPWHYQMWIFPRDPDFAIKAGRVLDLYAGWWQGQPLGPRDYVLSADEKTSIQARQRCHPSRAAIPGQAMQVEFEYERQGAVQYLAAWDVQRGQVHGRCEAHTGIGSFGCLVDQVMGQEPYRSATRVFWVVDNGSSHRGATSVARLAEQYPNLVLVHLPVHASWLNQIEIYFSIIQRKVLTPNDFPSCQEVERRLQAFGERMNAHPKPFAWRFTRADLDRRLREPAVASFPTSEAA